MLMAVSAKGSDPEEHINRLKEMMEVLIIDHVDFLNTQRATCSSKAGSTVYRKMKEKPRTYLGVATTV